MQDFEKLRKEYEHAGLDRSDLDPSPFTQFRRWFDVARERCPGNWFEPNAMYLATCGEDGLPSNRTVLLKHITADSFCFFTNYGSEKALQIDENPSVGLLFHWPYLGRQVRIDGGVARTSRELSREYFASRPRGARIGASISRQSRVAGSRAEIETLQAEFEARLAGGDVPLPDDWGGFAVTPQRFEFWQGRADRLHDRFRYERAGTTWRIDRLFP